MQQFKKLSILVFIIVVFFLFSNSTKAYNINNFTTNLPNAQDTGTQIGIVSNCSSNITQTYINYYIKLDNQPKMWGNGGGQPCYGGNPFLLTYSEYFAVIDSLFGAQNWSIPHNIRIYFADTITDDTRFWWSFDTNFYTTDISFNSPVLVGVYGSYVPFNGSYTNASGTYNQIIITIHNNTLSATDSIITLNASTGSNLPFSANILLLLNSNYSYSARLYNSTTYDESFSTLSIIFNTGQAVILPNQPPNLNYQNCSITDIGGCFSNALIYLVYPSDLAIDSLVNLRETIKNKPPMGYISSIISALGGISITGTPTLAFASFTPVNTYIFTPIRSGLIWVLWFSFAFILFKRFQHFQL